MAALIPSQLKMFLPMIIMWLYNKYGGDWSSDHIRIAYAASQGVALLVQLYILSRIEATASPTETIKVKSKSASGQEVTEDQTVKKYDAKQCAEALQRLILGAAFVVVLHMWKGFLQPLVIQSAMTLILLADEPLFRLYILGENADGKLARPFKKDAGPLAALLNPAGATDAVPSDEEPTAGTETAKTTKETRKSK